MKLVTVSGAHAAGKNEIAKIQFAAFGEDVLHRMVPCTTRKPRNGEVHGREYYYLEEDEFERLFQDDQFVYHVHIRKHRSGTIWSEFIRNEISLVDITPEGARCMRDLIRNEALGSALLIFVDAPPEQRKARILKRQSDLHPDAVEKMISLDPVAGDPSLYRDFDLVVQNPDGGLVEAAETVRRAIERFLTS